jgi:hypothetical protein
MAKDFKKVFARPKVVPLRRALFQKPRLVRRKRAEEPKWQRVELALLVRLEARPGKENELANCLRAGLTLVQQEPATASWFAIRLGPSTLCPLRCVPRRSRASGPSGGFTGGDAQRDNFQAVGSAAGDRKGRRAGRQAGPLRRLARKGEGMRAKLINDDAQKTLEQKA